MASSCSHSSTHLTSTVLRDYLGDGTDTNTIAIWTGHILNNNPSSNSKYYRHSIVLTPKMTTTYNSTTLLYDNKTDDKIAQESIFTLMHESSHQLYAPDHYCYGIKGTATKCSNEDCDVCYKGMGSTRIGCIMSYRYDISSLTNDNLYCSDCIGTIVGHLADHH